jgi:sigma-B regulation protein RsbU (phosphoserine phosphatase)
MMDDIFDKAPAGYFSFFDDGTIHLVNETLCSLLGYNKAELTGNNIETIFTIATRIFYQTHFFPLVKMHGHAEEIFISLLTKTGNHLPVLLNARREEDTPRPFTACSFIVVANRKKFEDELIAARREAETALRENTFLQEAKAELQKHTEQLDAQIHTINQQNHELKQLNHVITHSLKEPLRKILVYAEKINEYAFPDEIGSSVARLTKASQQMRNIITGLQQYIWLNNSPANFKTVNLSELVSTAAEHIKRKLKRNELQLDIGKLPSIEADAEQLALLMYHLLSNAVQFKKDDKAFVTVSASVIQQNRFTNVQGKYQYEDFVKLEVTDKGIGLDPSFTEDVFGLFKKLHFSEGIGLGLALCKKVVGNHAGYIKADSQLNEGTTITVTLPVLQTFSSKPYEKELPG